MTDKYTPEIVDELLNNIDLCPLMNHPLKAFSVLMNKAYEEGKEYGAGTVMVVEEILALKLENKELKNEKKILQDTFNVIIDQSYTALARAKCDIRICVPNESNPLSMDGIKNDNI